MNVRGGSRGNLRSQSPGSPSGVESGTPRASGRFTWVGCIVSSRAASDLRQARSLIAQARTLAPFDATYATQAGDFALDLDSSGNPSPNADWARALEAYSSAARLGSYAPETFQHLAITQEHFGNHVAAVTAARRALELDPYDPDSPALLAKLTS